MGNNKKKWWKKIGVKKVDWKQFKENGSLEKSG